MSSKILSTDAVIGAVVLDAEGEELGEVEEVMLDTETGHVAYAVLSIGGFLGIGKKLLSVPFVRLQHDAQLDRFLLDVDKDDLEDAPGFREGEEPRADYDFVDEVHVFYGVDPYWRAHTDDAVSVQKPPQHPTGVGSS